MPIAAPQPGLTLRERVNLHEPFGLLFTSGTSGTPKVAVLTWQNIIFSATGSAIQLGHLPNDRWLLVLPLCHVGGLSVVTHCALLGTTIVMPRRCVAYFEKWSVCVSSRPSGVSVVGSSIQVFVFHQSTCVSGAPADSVAWNGTRRVTGTLN